MYTQFLFFIRLTMNEFYHMANIDVKNSIIFVPHSRIESTSLVLCVCVFFSSMHCYHKWANKNKVNRKYKSLSFMMFCCCILYSEDDFACLQQSCFTVYFLSVRYTMRSCHKKIYVHRKSMKWYRFYGNKCAR